MNNINFTKLRTVIFDDTELTIDAFYKKMYDLINKDATAYSVNYDKEKDNYEIVYLGEKYIVNYRNEVLDSDCEKHEILEVLNRLVEQSKEQRKVQLENKDIEQEEELSRNIIFNNARDGILNTNEEKLARIEQLKEANKEFFRIILSDTLDTMEDINYAEFFTMSGTLALRGILAGFGFIGGVFVGGISLLSGVAFPLWLFILGLVLSVDGILSALVFLDVIDEYGGLFATLSSIVAAPFIFATYFVWKCIDRIRTIRDIRYIKKSITKLDKKIKTKVNIKNITKILENTKNSDDYQEIINISTELKNNIILIKDKKLSKEYATQLLEIIKYYVDAINNQKGSNKEKLPKIILNQVHDLKIKVDEVLRIEQEKERNNNKCDELIENIDHQKSIGAR